MNSYDPVWDAIYEAGQQLNRYPFSDIVTFLYRRAPRDRPRSAVRILEIGCGAANNLWFAAREGFAVTGLDGSPAALDYARKRFADEGLAGEFVTGDFTRLPFADASFDIVLERGALSSAPKPAARRAVEEAARVLAPGGAMFAFIYSDRSTARGRPAEGGMLVDIKGPFAGVGQLAFYGRAEIESLFAEALTLDSLDHNERICMLDKPYEVYAHWSLTATKPA